MPDIKIPLKSDGTLKTPVRTFFRLMFSDDNYMPSSSRVLGTWIFVFLSICLGGISGVVAYKLLLATDPAVITALVGAIRYLVWIYLMFMASGLSFYGIHVWKYIAQIQGGILTTPNTPSTPFSYTGSSYTRPLSTPPLPSTPHNPMDDDLPEPPTPPKKSAVAGIGSDD